MTYEYMFAIHYFKYMSLVSYEMIQFFIFMKYNMYYKSLPSHGRGHLFSTKILECLGWISIIGSKM